MKQAFRVYVIIIFQKIGAKYKMKKNSLFFLGVCLAAAALLIFSSCSAQENGAETGGMTEKETDAVGMTEKDCSGVIVLRTFSIAE